MKKTGIFFLSQVIFIFAAASAEMFTWTSVLEEALKINPVLENARSTLELADISYKSSYLNFFPDLSGSMSMRRSDSGSTSYGIGLNSSLSLFRGFKNVNEVKSKKANLTVQEATYKRKLADFVYDLRMAYAELLKTQMTEGLLSDIQSRRKNNMELVKLRYDAGREDRGAYLRSEADFLQSEYEMKSEERNFRIVRAKLLKNIGKDIYGVISVTGTFKVPEIDEKPSRALLESTPDYIIAKYRLDISELDLKSKYGDFYPNLSASGSVSRSGAEWFPDQDSWSVGLSLSYPFFSGGKDFYELKSAKLNWMITENDLENTGYDLMFQIESAYNDLIDSVEFYKVREKYYSARKERSDISREKYINGLISYQDWDSIENEYINAQKSLLDAEYNVFASWAKWLKVVGEEE
ncbi:MAG: TolC family protein [Elusimicrobia bacterium]|nr:TolC family protein [Elusimicrobiota bacterium]